MLYEKNREQSLSKELFKNPTAEYRGAPFWSWNTELNEDEVVRQAKIFNEMGFGGYVMHVRTGLATPYFGEKFNECIKAAVDEAKRSKSLAYLYDEDRWPSGFCGGMVTENKRYRQRFLLMTTKNHDSDPPETDEKGGLLSGSLLLAKYKVKKILGRLVSYRRLKPDENPLGVVWYAYLQVVAPTPYYNDTAYVDTMNKEAMDTFAEKTYGVYEKLVGGEYGKTIPAIFTDEPQVYRADDIRSSVFSVNMEKPWTDDFDLTYEKTYGESILDKLPELFWELQSGVSVTRYRYYDHLSERFAVAFSDNLGKRCDEKGIALTGHMMEEPTLYSQTRALGEAMRQYRNFGIPGIDMLCSRYEFTTAKQAQSAVRQYGREGMLSELYGVSRWDYDFRGYKVHGDWQAALGVTVRVPHLSHMSLNGGAKRDYPASIFFQSPWYQKFPILEDHFARVNTAMTRGKPVVDVAVIHPVESFWLKFGPLDYAGPARFKMEKRFSGLADILIRGGVDFDYICESTLPALCEKGGNPLAVGKMKYKTVIVSECITLRSTTLKLLEEFSKNGGKLIFVGNLPSLENAEPTPRPRALAETALRVKFEKEEILSAVEEDRRVGFYRRDNGERVDNVVYQLREDDGGLWLFAARANHFSQVNEDVVVKQKLYVKVKGEWQVSLWNTSTGEINAVSGLVEKGFTVVSAKLYNHDSLLLRYEKASENEPLPEKVKFKTSSLVKNNVPYTLSEPNVLLLDRAYFALDDATYSRFPEDILRLDNICRRKLSFKCRGGSDKQPYAEKKREAVNVLKLKFKIKSEIDYEKPLLGLENSGITKIIFNGVAANGGAQGFYVDKSIETVALSPLKKGINVLELELPFAEASAVENCYLLGDFGVKVEGSAAVVVEKEPTLSFSDLTKQGLPFYGGKVTFHTSFDGNGSDVKLSVKKFRAAVIEATALGETANIAFSPYTTVLPSNEGKTPLDVTVFVSRQNAFGPVHNYDAKKALTNPSSYYAKKRYTTPRYILSPAGILLTPAIYRQ